MNEPEKKTERWESLNTTDMSFVAEKIKSWGPALKKLAWPLILITVVTGVVVFFLSFSLARHKKIIAQLQGQIVWLQAKNKVEKVARERAEEKIKLHNLKKTDLGYQEKRKEIQHKLTSLEKGRSEALIRLKKSRDKIKKDKLDEVMKRANGILNSTF